MKKASSGNRKKDHPLQAAAHLIKQGRTDAAIAKLNAVLHQTPRMVKARLLLAEAQITLGQYGDASEQLRYCVDTGSWSNLDIQDQCDAAALTLACGDIPKALRLYKTILKQHPEKFDAVLGLARCLLHQKQYRLVLDTLNSCNAKERASSDSWNLLAGTAHLMLSHWEQAESLLTQCIELNPKNALAYNNIGILYKNYKKDRETALSYFQKSLSLNKELIDAAINTASIWMEGTPEQQDKAFDLISQFEPKHPDHYLLLHTIGQVEHRRKNWDNALQYYLRAHRINPNDPDLITNIGIWHFDKKNYNQSIEWLKKALDIAPDHSEAIHFLSVNYYNIGQLDLLIKYLEIIIGRNPNDQGARFLLSWHLLSAGDWELGFRDYAFRPSRHRNTACANGVPLATRLPDDMKGDRILIAQEQGIGDELFFLRFFPHLQQRGGEFHYYTTSKLAPLLQRTGMFSQVWSSAPPAEIFNAGVLVGDLPSLLGFGSNDTPPPAIPIQPLASFQNSAASILRAFGPPPYVGITWRAGTDFSKERQNVRLLDKSIPIVDIARWIPPGATVISLQRNPYPDEISTLAQALGRPVLDAAIYNDNLEQMLGLLSQLQHYFAVSNTNVHLAASLGLSCTVFVPAPPEWRWMLTGDRSVWFPNCRVVRQTPDGRWPAADHSDL